MRDAADQATQFLVGRRRSDLESDVMLTLALTRLLEIIGEAAKNVSLDSRSRLPSIPWKAIAGTRDRLAHGYFEVDHDILWQIVTRDLPPVIEALERHLAESAE